MVRSSATPGAGERVDDKLAGCGDLDEDHE
jgi:hypothetical protein